MNVNEEEAVDLLPLLLTEKQLVQLLQVSERSVERMKSTNEIPGVVRLLKNTVRFRRDVILDWIAAGCPKLEPGDNTRRRK